MGGGGSSHHGQRVGAPTGLLTKDRHIALVWSVPQRLSPPRYNRHFQKKGKHITPVASPASSSCHTQPVLHLLPWHPLALYSSSATEPEYPGTCLWTFSKTFLSFCLYLNGLKMSTLFTWSKSGTPMAGTSWMNMWDTVIQIFGEVGQKPGVDHSFSDVSNSSFLREALLKTSKQFLYHLNHLLPPSVPPGNHRIVHPLNSCPLGNLGPMERLQQVFCPEKVGTIVAVNDFRSTTSCYKPSPPQRETISEKTCD